MPTLGRTLRNTAKSFIDFAFHTGQRMGIDILPRHFYSSIPDIRALKRNSYWREPTSMVGVNGADPETQLAFVQSCCSVDVRKRFTIKQLVAEATTRNGEIGYGPIEAAFLYCYIQTTKPRRVIQVGAGFSTAVILRAAKEIDHAIDITCIDPFPNQLLQTESRNGTIRLIGEGAEVVAMEKMTDLGEGDLFFVDSTHTVKVGSEVNRIILEVLPRLKHGVHVHFHDIYFPYDYGLGVLKETFFSCETTLLHAYLADNPRYTILASLSMLHHGQLPAMRELFPEYEPLPMNHGVREGDTPGHFPSSLFLKVQ